MGRSQRRTRTTLLVTALTLAATGAGASVAAPAIADAASQFTIMPLQPNSTSAITVTFKVPKKLPKGQHWILAISDPLSPPQSCASYDQKDFSTRGTKGQILKATFRPEQDILDTNPTAWCTGSPAASRWAVAAISAVRRDKEARVVAHRLFTIM